MADYPLTAMAQQALSPSNVILTDDLGMPSFMARIPKFLISDVIPGGSETTHPAFVVNGREVDAVYISAYQNVIQNGRAYSHPLEDPQTGLDFDAALSACTAKGKGWHLMTRAEWAALALWCRQNGLMPKGNNDHGKDVADGEYEAIPASCDGETTARVLCGSGPLTWSHNGQQGGIYDLNGNVAEWTGGCRVVDGELQVLADNNAADAANSQAASSSAWMAMLEDGALAAPGTAGTLKWDYVTLPDGGGVAYRLNNTLFNQQAAEDDGYGRVSFSELAAADGVTVPERLKALGLFPADGGDHGGDQAFMRNTGERMGTAGGSWLDGAAAGVFCQRCSELRTAADAATGFRCAYVSLPE